MCLSAYAVFEWRLLCIVLNTLLYATLHLTNVVHALSNPGPIRIPLLPEGIYVLSHIAYLVLLCYTYQWFAFESVKISYIMQNLLLRSSSFHLKDRQEMFFFVEQIEMQDSRCRVLGLFTLDTVTMLTVISGVCSYMIVMLQFQVSLS